MEAESPRTIVASATDVPDFLADAGALPFVSVPKNLLSSALNKLGKRALDIGLCLMMIVAFGPIMLVLAAYIAFVYRIPPIFRHTRVGLDGRQFKCYKFRTMRLNSDDLLEEILRSDPKRRLEWEVSHKFSNDPRVLPGIGRLLRKSSLDELPQTINVLFGQMSVVGPRPVTEEEFLRYGDFQSYYTAVKPGITGAWQVGGRSNTTFEERVSLDAWYVKNASLGLDIRIFLKTVFLFMSGRLLGGV